MKITTRHKYKNYKQQEASVKDQKLPQTNEKNQKMTEKLKKKEDRPKFLN